MLGFAEVRQAIETQEVSVWQFLLSFAIGTAIILLLIKYVKKGYFLKLGFYTLIFIGCLSFFDVWLPYYLTIILALAITLLRHFIATLLVHNISLVIALAGISAYLGVSLTVWQVLIILLVLAVYDVVAVHKTRHMVKMFNKLTSSGAIFAIVVPSRLKNILANLRRAQPGAGYLFLGTGDLAFPIILAVAALKADWAYSLAIIVGAWLGMIGMNIFQLVAKYDKPMAALPPIAGGGVLGFLVVWVIRWLII